MKQTMIDYVQKPKGDEFFTPVYAILPLLKYLKPNSRIWCPFDKVDSEFVKVLKNASHKVWHTHIDDNLDFFNDNGWGNDNKHNFDYIISNPPYSIKNQVLEKLYQLNIPFAMLMPLTTLETNFRTKLFTKYGLELLVFDKRINFVKNKSSNWFNTSYFCRGILPKQLIFEELERE